MPARQRKSSPPSAPPPSLVVGVGASAGGLEAFKQLLSALPSDAGMAFILVQHLDPTHKSLLKELLEPCTAMRVVEAEHGLALHGDTVYIIPPNRSLGVRNDRLELSAPTERRGLRLPVDHLFHALAREFGTGAAGIVLSGAGSDGSDGLRAIKAAGGLTLAQDPGSSQQSGMPQSAIDTGTVDLVLPIASMPDALERFRSIPPGARNPSEPGADAEPVSALAEPFLPDTALNQLAGVLEAQADFDLRVYKTGTIRRRVYRRMALSGLEDPDRYLQQLREDRHEQQALIRDLLISVTDFFRDPDAFDSLRTMVVEPVVRNAAPGDTIRVWVPGCATGEEPYSLAIELLDVIHRYDARLSVQIFATDIDQEALAVARAGIYPPTTAERMSAERLQRYFKPLAGKGYQVLPLLRDAVSFAVHDVTKDPPFSRMHVISCRNLLIYLRPDAQEHVLRVLQFALLPTGCLFLGTAESTGAQKSLYTTISKRWRLYRKAGPSRPMAMGRSRLKPVASASDRDPHQSTMHEATTPRDPQSEVARRLVMQTRVPPSIVVGASGAVIFMHGELRPYLRFPEGDPRLELSELVSPRLGTRVRAALYRSRRDKSTVVAFSSPDQEGARRVKITATPAFDLGDDAVIVSFEEAADEPTPSSPQSEPAGSEAALEQLERELIATREDLRNTVEELESSNEELRSSNEESMSMNEELQSANEELEATTEELRSLNEELTTVNGQLREKIELLEQAHDDLGNFFASTKVATLFLDERLCIKRFTPACEDLMRLDHADEGRFVGDIARELLQNGLVDDAREVLDQLAAKTREIRTRDHRWITRQVLPYRTESRRIEGVVVTYTDVTRLRETADRLAVRERQQATIARLGIRALEETHLQGFFERATREIQETLGTDFCKILELQPGGELFLLRAGAGWHEGTVGHVTVPSDLNSQAGYTLAGREPVIVEDMASERRFSGPALLVEHEVVSGVSCAIRGSDEPYGVLGAHSRTRRTFSQEDAHFLQAAAAVIAGAIGRHATRVRLGLEGAVGRVLTEAPTLAIAVARVHVAAVEQFGEGIGEFWQPDRTGGLARAALFVEGPLDETAVRRSFGPATEIAGQGLVGRVFATGRAELVSSLQGEAVFPRGEAARRLGLSTGIAFPITNANGILGVFTHFSRRRMNVDQVLLRSLESIGRSIGDFARRTEAEQRLRATVDHAPVGFADRSIDGRWLRVNDRLCEITGYTREELVGQPFHQIVHPDDLEREVSLIEAVRAGTRDHYAIEKRYLRKDKTAVWVAVSAEAVRRPSGAPDYCVVVIEDISTRKKAEEQLRISESRFRDVLRHSPVPIMLYDDRGAVLAISDSWVEFTGYTLDEISTAERWMQLAYRENADAMRATAREVWNEDPRPHRYEHRIWTKRGEAKTVLLSAVPLGSSPDGHRLRVATAVDVTAQRTFERETAEASRQKDEFIAMLSHELRNPLAAVRTAAEVLKTAADTNPIVQQAQGILARQTAHMAKLLDGLLDISRIVRGKLEIEREPIDLAAVVRMVTDDARPAIEAAGLEFDVTMPVAPVWVLGDGIRLTQVVDNLLTNARKFTPPPGTVGVQLAAADGTATLTVRDSGVGIDEQLLPQVFEVFQQGFQRIDRAQGGLGLGLALVKLLVDLHGGTVRATSQGGGRGSEFIVAIPLTIAPKPIAPSRAGTATMRRRILVVEDNRDAADMLRLALESRGHEVVVAARGVDAVAIARRQPLDVILCDLGLPEGVTGYDVARTIRADGSTREVGLIAVSGYGRPEDRQRAADAGFDAHLTKPVSLDDLDAMLDGLADTRR